MRKMLLDGDSVLIDGVELTKEEIKQAMIDQVKYNRMADFLQTTFNKEVEVWVNLTSYSKTQ